MAVSPDNFDGEHAVGATRVVIQLGCSKVQVLLAVEQNTNGFVGRTDANLLQTYYGDNNMNRKTQIMKRKVIQHVPLT